MIFLKSYRLLLKKLREERPEDLASTEISLEGVTAQASSFRYCTHTARALHCTALHCTALHCTALHTLPSSVASGPVSMHLPLSRLLAGLSLLLDSFSLSFHCDDFKLVQEDMPTVEELLELPLRTAVMVSQVGGSGRIFDTANL